MYWCHDERQQLINFWCRAGRREVCWVVTAEPQQPHAGVLSQGQDIDVRYVHAKSLATRTIWIENWMHILPYLSSNARFVSEQLLADIELATVKAQTLGEIEREFQPHDIVLVRTAAFMLLHRGRLKADALRVHPLGSEIRLRRVRAHE